MATDSLSTSNAVLCYETVKDYKMDRLCEMDREEIENLFADGIRKGQEIRKQISDGKKLKDLEAEGVIVGIDKFEEATFCDSSHRK